ncbi:LysR family transcriptional regulator [Pseudomonas syringae]|uniref:LysR family transcriptional regulator n=2 Tax=Pseudomonas syringae TaxID=317 RepID=A0A1C7Z015_PSESX|nr:LysR family transcriptional regulator [Pseudomonas syringae]
MITGSTVKAAELIHTSQPVVSRLIGQLEVNLRLKLFERESSRLRPTPEAKALFIDVEKFYSGLEQLAEKAQSLREGRSGLLSIACLPALAYGPMPKFLAELQRQLPNLSVRLEINSSNEVRELIASGRCDIGFAAQEIDTHGIVARSIARRRALLAVPNGHPLATLSTVSVLQLADYPYLSLSSTDSTQRFLNGVMAEAGKTLKIAIETPYTLTIASLVMSGAGVGLIDPVALEGFDWPGLTLIPLKEDVDFNTLVIHSATAPLSGPGNLLIDIAQGHLSGSNPL